MRQSAWPKHWQAVAQPSSYHKFQGTRGINVVGTYIRPILQGMTEAG